MNSYSKKPQCCFIYGSSKKNEMYLYINDKDNFDDVPEVLLNKFGGPTFVMMLDLSQRKSLARESLTTVKQNLAEQGYHLQMPPKIEKLYEKNS